MGTYFRFVEGLRFPNDGPKDEPDSGMKVFGAQSHEGVEFHMAAPSQHCGRNLVSLHDPYTAASGGR